MKTQTIILTALVAITAMLISTVVPTAAQGNGKYAASRAHLLDLHIESWACKTHKCISLVHRSYSDTPYEETKLGVTYYQYESKWYLNNFHTY